MEEEEYVNVEVTATMSAESYAMLAAVLAAWIEDHSADDPHAAALLKDIKFSRTR